MKSVRPTVVFLLLVTTAGVVGCGGGSEKKPSPEERLIGKWEVNMTAIKEEMKEKSEGQPGAELALAMLDPLKVGMEFKKDNAMTFTSSFGEKSESADGKWEVVKSSGKTVTIKMEMKNPQSGETEGDEVPLTFVNDDTIEMKPPKSANMEVETITIKRVKE